MLHSSLQEQTVNLINEYNKFNIDFNNHIETFESCSDIKKQKFIVDQLIRDLQQNYMQINQKQLSDKLNNASLKLEDVNMSFLRGMLNNGFFTEQ
ncbi:hypothetical protein N9Z41_02110 [bacterium]|nr:hypothetical protein [bacterium]